jgi:hypothetical protein
MPSSVPESSLFLGASGPMVWLLLKSNRQFDADFLKVNALNQQFIAGKLCMPYDNQH